MKILLDIISDYPWIWILIWVGIGVAALILNKITNVALNFLGDKKRIQFKFIKSIFWGIAIPSVGMWFWFSSYNNPFNEYRLITNCSKANGFITKISTWQDVVEYNDSRSGAVVDHYGYEFNFKLPNGKVITGNGDEYGDIPSHLANVDSKPYPVVIEYLFDNPQVNRVQGMEAGNKTLYEWFRYPILIGVIVLALCSYFGIKIIKGGLKDYKKAMQTFEENMKERHILAEKIRSFKGKPPPGWEDL